MAPKSIIAAASLIAIAAVGYYFSTSMKPAQTSVESTDRHAAVQLDMPTDAGSKTPLRVANHVQSDAPEPESERYDPTTGRSVKMEKVEGIWVKADRNCTVKIEMYNTAEDGTQTPVYSCVPNKPRALDIYTTYSTEELKTLAYSDAHAAHTLSIRLREKDFSLAVDYALRATALSGEGKYVGAMLNLIPSTFVDGKKDRLAYYEQGYVLSGVATAYDIPVKVHTRWARRGPNLQGNDINIEELDARIVSLLEKIDSIREEVGIN